MTEAVSNIDLALEGLKLTLTDFVKESKVKEIVEAAILDNNCNKDITLVQDNVRKDLPKVERHYLFPDVLTAVSCNIPGALIGPAGAGKSTLCEQIASALDTKFYLQNGVTGTHELTGYTDAYSKYVSTPFREAYEKGGLILIDEVDSSEASALKWINTALANGHAAFPDKVDPVTRHEKFRILIAANTYGTGADRMYVGANQLDASTLDRFVFFDFFYDEKLELQLSGNHEWCRRVQKLRRAALNEKARIIISPRASINGAKLIKAGWNKSTVEERLIWKGVDAELKARIIKKAA